jgi:DNA-binding Xre family transcriptional regulator
MEDDVMSEEETPSDAELAKGYEYLLGMKIWSLTYERATELRKQLAEKKDEVSQLETTKPETIWLNDLEAIEEALDERDMELDAEAKKESRAQSKAKVRVAKAASKRAKKSKKKKDEVSSSSCQKSHAFHSNLTSDIHLSFQWDSDLEDSDDEEDNYVAPKKPKAAPKKKSPPKKQLVSVGNAESGTKNVNKLSKSKTVDSKAVPKKKSKPAAKENVQPDDEDDIFEDDESTGEPALMSRSRRSRANVSYTVDGSLDEELDDEIDDEPGDDEIEDDIVDTKAKKQSNMHVEDVSSDWRTIRYCT